ncbi:MSS116 [Candida theae]|uniref:ATP-dependent RNA helicase n=1 Tax=Candida theae TaxID=1198502 RepID=A0AAD5BEM9_9ASCO|nr:MSS116 [Candida theae]KAI5957994.1 MSS116 [Candida theae]
MLLLKHLEKQVLRNAVAINHSKTHCRFRAFHSTSTFKNENSIQVDTKPIKPISTDQADGKDTKSKPKDTTDSAEFLPVKFSDLKGKGFINNAILNALHKAKFDTLTPIQQKALIPIIKSEKGVVCRAKTGTGKTLTFIIPTVESAIKRMTQEPDVQGVDSVIVAPTRDLALQIRDEYGKVCAKLPRSIQPRVSMIIGGQRTTFNYRSPSEIVITTPGRLEADLKDPRFSKWFRNVNYRVYDEADRLLDVGFEPQLNSINRVLRDIREEDAPPMKSLLFSATVDDSITRFAQQHINRRYDYINTVPKDEPEVHENVHQILYKCEDGVDKFQSFFDYVVDVVKNEEKAKMILFLPTQTAVDWFYDYMQQATRSPEVADSYLDFGIYLIHGNRTAYQRKIALADFKHCDRGLLISTDVAARGIDVKGVTHVIQLFPSSEVADYVHKVGRTGRAGAKGKAILFTSQSELPYVRKLKRERGVDFQEIIESTPEKIHAKVFDSIKPSPHQTNEFFFTFMNYVIQVKSMYRLDANHMIEDTVNLYRSLLKDDTAKLSISSLKHAARQLDRTLLREYFEHKGGREIDSFRENGRGPRHSNNRASRFSGSGGGGGGYRDLDNYRRRGSGGNRQQKRSSFSDDDRGNFRGQRRSSYNTRSYD